MYRENVSSNSAQGFYLVEVRLCVVELCLACRGLRALRELARGTGWSGERVLGKHPHPHQPQAAGAEEEYSPPPHPHRLQNTSGSKMISEYLNPLLWLYGFIKSRDHNPTYPPCQTRLPCRCPRRAVWSWRKWGCCHRSSPHSSPLPDS